ncbi:MAG TPA: PilZ domain-containing protein [Candidatus Sulfotelmatobacter sp.]
MTTPPLRVERRVGQRFPYLLATSFRQTSDGIEGVGFTQDLSSRGVFFLTDAPLTEGSEIELTLRMPSEITLGQSMPVRCKGRILRIVRPNGTSPNPLSDAARAKIGVAVRLECYEYLPECADSPIRVAALHPRHEEEQRQTQTPSARLA